jgi:hypothetical protein
MHQPASASSSLRAYLSRNQTQQKCREINFKIVVLGGRCDLSQAHQPRLIAKVLELINVRKFGVFLR